MRTFTVYRPGKTGKPLPQAPQFQGVQFSDGTVAIRWLSETRSTATFADFASMWSVHGHDDRSDYNTKIVWHDREMLQQLDQAVAALGRINQFGVLDGYTMSPSDTAVVRESVCEAFRVLAPHVTDERDPISNEPIVRRYGAIVRPPRGPAIVPSGHG